MKYRLLGQTGLYVSELCLGTMTYGSAGFWEVMGGLDRAAVSAQVKYAFDRGINFIDTANVYSMGQSEQLVGQAIHDLGLPRDELVISTKATGIMNDLPNGRGQSRFHLMNEVDASLQRLKLDHLDLYLLHGLDPLTPLEEALDTLNDLVRSGKVRYIGLCNMAAWQIMKGLAISEKRGWSRFVTVQAYYTIAGRDLEREVVPLIRDQGLGLMVWSPLAGGLLTGKLSPDGKGLGDSRRSTFEFPVVNEERAFRCVDAMRPMAEQRGVSVARIALAWLLAKQPVSSVIIGARTIDQLKDNLEAAEVALNAEELEMLDQVSQLPEEYPGWMLERQKQYRAVVPERKG
ncbi:MAG: aldo/keto reductase [Deltaproteobacteria bacterium]|nr:aldo/keto reductase [Deltaproteobacteria bacterium]